MKRGRKRKPDPQYNLADCVELAHSMGMRYSEFQQRETLGEFKFSYGRLYKKNKEGNYEPYEPDQKREQ